MEKIRSSAVIRPPPFSLLYQFPAKMQSAIFLLYFPPPVCYTIWAVKKAYEEYMMGYGKEPAIEHGERVLRFMTHLKFKASNTANNY
jgi:hypothetical protein